MIGQEDNGKMSKPVVRSFRDLDVYRLLCDLHLEVCEATHRFPHYELFELGGQLRRSSNSVPANIAEGWSNRHLAIYIEGVNRALGELQETLHHLDMAHRKGYLTEEKHGSFADRYDRCGRMLKSLERALAAKREQPRPASPAPHDP